MGKNDGWPNDHKSEDMDTSIGSMDPRKCDKCDYEAESMYDLDGHTWSEHDDVEEDEESDQVNRSNRSYNADNSFVCTFCDDNFKTQRDLMKHKKMDHLEKIAQCWKYSAGNCEFGDENCWFDHCSKKSKKWVWCEDVFSSQSDFHSHQKVQHRQFVPMCKNFKTCIYGEEICWFNHENIMSRNEDENIANNENMIKKLIQMMEKITERMLIIEESNPKIQE